jgi:hypothetical protein
MKYFYTLIPIAAVVVFQIIGANLSGTSKGVPHDRGGAMYGRVAAKDAIELPSRDSRLGEAGNVAESGRPYGLHYDQDENSWTLYATVLQLKKTSVYGRPGEIAQIEYSLDGQRLRNGWIVVRIDSYSFVDGTSQVTAIETGQNVQLYVSGVYVSSLGVDWDKCPKDDTYCMHAGFVEGGFPKSEDYDGLTLCPTNTIIRAGFIPGDWINGLLAWQVRSYALVAHKFFR